MIQQQGYTAVWKDWDKTFINQGEKLQIQHAS